MGGPAPGEVEVGVSVCWGGAWAARIGFPTWDLGWVYIVLSIDCMQSADTGLGVCTACYRAMPAWGRGGGMTLPTRPEVVLDWRVSDPA